MKLLFLFVGTNLCLCQNKFIEVEVKDTIQLKPLKFMYQVKVEMSDFIDYDEGRDYNSQKVKNTLKIKDQELKQTLQDLGYQCKSSNDMGYDVGGYTDLTQSGYIIELHNKQELQKIKDQVKKIEYASGTIIHTQFENPEANSQRLFKKLIAKAQQKAAMLAQLSNVKLGSIISLKEVKEIDGFSFNLMDIFIESRSSIGWNSNIDFSEFSGSYSEAIVVRYAVE